ncbi:DUF3048 domain-containing protein [Planomicrobium sp. CPCC 101079]|uniref:DUF3048 domain-containing protein n=1 Tax=Planomicrobium sp. CPCC 101079 TaxID=2599618 RepID=UPI0011B49034|nr:DUF3048 domain-containing protein [Planomicrobium sp. CPCC 101079]TWT13483.1 DUF3048 domain-containing protein [Planomicrobium sp. CPCC 101079]
MKKWTFGILAVLLLVAGAAFYLAGNQSETEQKPENPPVEEPESYKAPFSGIEGTAPFDSRPIMAVINNHPDARPQTGLTEADIVFEMLAEGDVTRFLALYQSGFPEVMGPVRSARDYFVELAEGYNGFFVAHGWSPDAKELLESGTVDHINGLFYDGTLFDRSTDRIAPHNSYITYENVLKGMDEAQASTEYSVRSPYYFYGSGESDKLMEQASVLEVLYGTSQQFHNEFTYDETTELYSRASGGTATTDKDSGEPVEVSNVLVFEADHETIDDEGRQSIDLTSGGKALVFQNGGVREAEWSNLEGMLVPTDNGQSIGLVAGKTWIHIVPKEPGISGWVRYSP